jgi:hypothetical protein
MAAMDGVSAGWLAPGSSTTISIGSKASFTPIEAIEAREDPCLGLRRSQMEASQVSRTLAAAVIDALIVARRHGVGHLGACSFSGEL